MAPEQGWGVWVPVCELLLTPCSARCSALAQGTGRGQLCPVDGAGVPSGTLKVTGTGQEGLGGGRLGGAGHQAWAPDASSTHMQFQT